MKKCSQCGAPLPEGELFCPECGQEVQLVPDYETMGSRLQEQQRSGERPNGWRQKKPCSKSVRQESLF